MSHCCKAEVMMIFHMFIVCDGVRYSADRLTEIDMSFIANLPLRLIQGKRNDGKQTSSDPASTDPTAANIARHNS